MILIEAAYLKRTRLYILIVFHFDRIRSDFSSSLD